MNAVDHAALERILGLPAEVEDAPGAGVQIDRADQQQPVLLCGVSEKLNQRLGDGIADHVLEVAVVEERNVALLEDRTCRAS